MAQSSVAGPLILPGRASVLGHFPFLGEKQSVITFSKWFPGTNVACVVHSGSVVASVSTK